MKQQYRDENGKFAKKTNWKAVAVVITFVIGMTLWGIIPIWIGDARTEGYSAGYAQGKEDTFAKAFEKGREIERNWTTCSWYKGYYLFADPPPPPLCNKKNPNMVRHVDSNYDTTDEFIMPEFNNMTMIPV